MLKINPNQPALWRNLHSLQIGAGRRAVVLDALSDSQERLIAALYKGIADRQLPNLLRDLNLTEGEGDQLVAKLEPVLLEQSAPPSRDLDEEFVASAFAEIIRASLNHSVQGEQVLLQRALRTVHISELSGCGLTLALALAAAGFGRVTSHDRETVSPGDIAVNGFASQFLAKPRIDSLRALLAAAPGQMRVVSANGLTERNLESIDCAVIFANQALEPRSYVQWLNRDVPHLAVVFGADSVWVSPLIVPGRGPCLYCLEQSRIDQDGSWPVLLSQLVTHKNRLDDASSRLFAAGLVLQKILAHCDAVGGFSQTDEELCGYELNHLTGTVSEVRWQPHEACSCRLGSGQQFGEKS
ncbi:MAG: hypothetical protein RL670_1213 [Actinomycetota bacterium]